MAIELTNPLALFRYFNRNYYSLLLTKAMSLTRENPNPNFTGRFGSGYCCKFHSMHARHRRPHQYCWRGNWSDMEEAAGIVNQVLASSRRYRGDQQNDASYTVTLDANFSVGGLVLGNIERRQHTRFF